MDILKYSREQLPPNLTRIEINIDSVQENLSLLWLIKPVQKLNQGSLPRAVHPHNADLLAGLYLPGKSLQHPGLASGIPEPDILELKALE